MNETYLQRPGLSSAAHSFRADARLREERNEEDDDDEDDDKRNGDDEDDDGDEGYSE